MAFAVTVTERGGGSKRIVFHANELTVGRSEANDLVLPGHKVSGRHAKLIFRGGRFMVSDLNSSNGTYVNGRKLTQTTVVREGDRIFVGQYVLQFESTPGALVAPDSVRHAGSSAKMPARTPMPPISEGPAPQIIVEVRYGDGAAHVFAYERYEVRLGRHSQDNELVLNSSEVSRRHARLYVERHNLWIEDCQSAGGVWLNDARLAAPTRISHFDRLRIGGYNLSATLRLPHI